MNFNISDYLLCGSRDCNPKNVKNIYIYIYIYICMFVCVYIYIYVYVCVYIYVGKYSFKV